MPVGMNPNINEKRGCFIREDKANKKWTVVDYPTWTAKTYGFGLYPGQNYPIPDGQPCEVTFGSRKDAVEYCAAQNYVICASPRPKKEGAPEPVDQDDDFEI